MLEPARIHTDPLKPPYPPEPPEPAPSPPYDPTRTPGPLLSCSGNCGYPVSKECQTAWRVYDRLSFISFSEGSHHVVYTHNYMISVLEVTPPDLTPTLRAPLSTQRQADSSPRSTRDDEQTTSPTRPDTSTYVHVHVERRARQDVYMYLSVSVTSVTPLEHWSFQHFGGRPPIYFLFFYFLFSPPPHRLSSPGPPTEREINSARPGRFRVNDGWRLSA